MGKTGAAAALVLATETPEGGSLAKLLAARVEREGSANLPPKRGLTATLYDARTPPGITLTEYLGRWVTYAHSDASIIVFATCYMDRMMAFRKIKLTPHNVHRILLSALIIAAKLRDDTPYANQHYAEVGGVSHGEINRLECAFLSDLQWDLCVTKDQYQATLESLCPTTARERKFKDTSVQTLRHADPAALRSPQMSQAKDPSESVSESGSGSNGCSSPSIESATVDGSIGPDADASEDASTESNTPMGIPILSTFGKFATSLMRMPGRCAPSPDEQRRIYQGWECEIDDDDEPVDPIE